MSASPRYVAVRSQEKQRSWVGYVPFLPLAALLTRILSTAKAWLATGCWRQKHLNSKCLQRPILTICFRRGSEEGCRPKSRTVKRKHITKHRRESRHRRFIPVIKTPINHIVTLNISTYVCTFVRMHCLCSFEGMCIMSASPRFVAMRSQEKDNDRGKSMYSFSQLVALLTRILSTARLGWPLGAED